MNVLSYGKNISIYLVFNILSAAIPMVTLPNIYPVLITCRLWNLGSLQRYCSAEFKPSAERTKRRT